MRFNDLWVNHIHPFLRLCCLSVCLCLHKQITDLNLRIMELSEPGNTLDYIILLLYSIYGNYNDRIVLVTVKRIHLHLYIKCKYNWMQLTHSGNRFGWNLIFNFYLYLFWIMFIIKLVLKWIKTDNKTQTTSHKK